MSQQNSQQRSQSKRLTRLQTAAAWLAIFGIPALMFVLAALNMEAAFHG